MTVMSEHTAKAFDVDLQDIARRVAEMGGNCLLLRGVVDLAQA